MHFWRRNSCLRDAEISENHALLLWTYDESFGPFPVCCDGKILAVFCPSRMTGRFQPAATGRKQPVAAIQATRNASWN
jgi:hypothetical protein